MDINPHHGNAYPAITAGDAKLKNKAAPTFLVCLVRTPASDEATEDQLAHFSCDRDQG